MHVSEIWCQIRVATSATQTTCPATGRFISLSFCISVLVNDNINVQTDRIFISSKQECVCWRTSVVQHLQKNHQGKYTDTIEIRDYSLSGSDTILWGPWIRITSSVECAEDIVPHSKLWCPVKCWIGNRIIPETRIVDAWATPCQALLHCHGGVGRTGTIVACYYIYFEHILFEEALDKMRRQYTQSPRSRIMNAPETKRQIEFVKTFADII